MSDVLIREVGLRDGLQLVKNILPTEKKIKWLNKQSLLNFKEIEVTSFVPKKVVPQFFDAEIIIYEANKISNLTSSVLVPNLFGAKKALELNAQKINYVLSASESHNKANVNKDVNSSINELNEIINYNNNLEKKSSICVAISTSFGCSIEGKVSPNKVLNIVEKVTHLGVDEINIADTVGYGNPYNVKYLFKHVIEIAGKDKIFAHFHDTRGLGLANVIAVLELGIFKFDSSLCGLGGCPFAPGASGNIPTEDLIYLLKSLGIHTGINLNSLLDFCKFVKDWFPNEKLEGKLSKAGLPVGF